MRHAELKAAIEATGLEVHRGERVAVGFFVWFTSGGERQNIQWIGPPAGDCDIDFVSTADKREGVGFSLRSLRLAVAFVVGEIFGWEASLAEKHAAIEKTEAKTSQGGRNGKNNAGVCTPRTSNPERRRSVAPRG